MTVWQNKMFRGCLAGRPCLWATRETQLSSFVLTFRIQVMCRAYASFRRLLSRELPTKTLLSSIAWAFTHSLFITQPLQLNPTINIRYKRLNKITIKFFTKLKPTKFIVVNYNFTVIPTILYTIHCGFSLTPTSPFQYPWKVDSPNTYHTHFECHVRFWCCWKALEETKLWWTQSGVLWDPES